MLPVYYNAIIWGGVVLRCCQARTFYLLAAIRYHLTIHFTLSINLYMYFVARFAIDHQQQTFMPNCHFWLSSIIHFAPHKPTSQLKPLLQNKGRTVLMSLKPWDPVHMIHLHIYTRHFIYIVLIYIYVCIHTLYAICSRGQLSFVVRPL